MDKSVNSCAPRAGARLRRPGRKVHAAPQHAVAGPFMPKLARTPLAVQLWLGLGL